MNQNKDLSNIVQAFPGVIIEINRVIDLPETDYKSLSFIIEKDPAICAKILKIVNSAYYGMSSTISSIPDAVSILGFDTVHQIALTISVMNIINDKKAAGFDTIHLWKHSFFTAAISRYMSSNFDISHPDEAYITALLHDIGKFILFKLSPQYFYKIKQFAADNKIGFHIAEKRIKKGPTHAALGAQAAIEWKFPQTIIDAIKYHHEYSKNAVSKESLILLILANYIEKNKKFILNSGINLDKMHPEITKLLHEPLVDITNWLPELIKKSEKEFNLFTKHKE